MFFFRGIRSHSEIFSGRKVFRMRKLIYGNHSSLLQDHYYYESNVHNVKSRGAPSKFLTQVAALKSMLKEHDLWYFYFAI